MQVGQHLGQERAEGPWTTAEVTSCEWPAGTLGNK